MENTLTLGDLSNEGSYLSSKVRRINKSIIGKEFGITPDSLLLQLCFLFIHKHELHSPSLLKQIPLPRC